MFDDAALQVDEGGNAAATDPADSCLERLDSFVVAELEDQPERVLRQRIGLLELATATMVAPRTGSTIVRPCSFESSTPRTVTSTS